MTTTSSSFRVRPAPECQRAEVLARTPARVKDLRRIPVKDRARVPLRTQVRTKDRQREATLYVAPRIAKARPSKGRAFFVGSSRHADRTALSERPGRWDAGSEWLGSADLSGVGFGVLNYPSVDQAFKFISIDLLQRDKMAAVEYLLVGHGSLGLQFQH